MRYRRSGTSLLSLVLVLVALLLPDASAFGDTFEWVDQSGTVHSAPSLDKVPLPYRQSVKRIPDPKAPGKGGAFQTMPGTSMPRDTSSSAPSLQNTYAPWRERMRHARAELDTLKTQREKVQTAYEDLLRQLRMRGNPIDPEQAAGMVASLKDLEQRIHDKEYEINTTIPDEARQAGVPSSTFDQ